MRWFFGTNLSFRCGEAGQVWPSFDGGKNLFEKSINIQSNTNLMEIRDEITKLKSLKSLKWKLRNPILYTWTIRTQDQKKTKQTSRWSKERSSCPESFLHIRSLEVLHEFSRRKFLRIHVPRHPPTEHQ